MNEILDRVAAVLAEREGTYGPCEAHWSRTVGMINALYGTAFTPRDWATFMMLDKLARDAGPAPSADTGVDLIGYATLRCRVESRGR